MKALVLGGNRFIGRRLVERLLERGDQVTVLNRGQRPDPFGGRVRRVKGDRRRAEDLARAAHGGRDAVFDFLCYDADDASMAVEAFGGRTARYVMISTGSVYWCTGDFPCPVPEEDFDRLGDFPERPGSIEYAYGYAKRKAEETIFAAHREGSLAATACRLPIVGGEMDPTLRYISYFHRIDDGGPLVLPDAGAACFRHAWVDDVAAALPGIAEAPAAAGRAYNLACDEIMDLRTLVRIFGEMLGKRPVTVSIPFEVLDARGLDRAFSPFSQPASQVPAIRRARQELGWRPTPWTEWIERAARWYRDYYRAGDPPQYAHRAREIEIAGSYRASLGLSPAS